MSIKVIDSHTEGEPTRVIVEGAPDLGAGSLFRQAELLTSEFDHVRTAVVLEPRGSDVLVAAFLRPPETQSSDAGVIFVNNAGILGMCVHGMIGVVRTLQHLGRASTTPGETIRLDTPVGTVTATVEPDGVIAVENVASRRTNHRVPVQLDDRLVHADIAWGGNWFALIDDHGERIEFERRKELTELASKIRRVMNDAGLDGTGARGGPIDHVELFGPPVNGGDGQNFVLCPGGAYDRSPCGTGTSAKLACLAADGRLAEGATWIQESIIGSRFAGTWRAGEEPGTIIPTISGQAWITGESMLHLDPEDPYRFGIS
ncbi:MAG: proline racemase family protein [Phycisphaerales bacterium]|nr:proline racemase family protein [Phycisphaerales bacterium]